MAHRHTDEFRREAVRIALTSGLSRKQVASDLGVGFSTLAKWIQKSKPQDLPAATDLDLAKENERLRKANRLLMEERDILKRPRCSSPIKASEICVCRRAQEARSGGPALSYSECYITWIPFMAVSSCQSTSMSLSAARYLPAGHWMIWWFWPTSVSNIISTLAAMRRTTSDCVANVESGRPRMTQELKEAGLAVGHRRVGRLMRENGIRVVRTRKYKATTDSNHRFNIAPNWLDRNFHADRPNQKWAGDISYVWTRQGWLYLAVIIDLHSRRVVGWAVSNRLKKDLALQALNRAVALRNPPPGCLHHTDRGSQYCSHDYQKRMRQLGFKVSPFGGASLACQAKNEPERKLLGHCRGGDILQNAQS